MVVPVIVVKAFNLSKVCSSDVIMDSGEQEDSSTGSIIWVKW